MMKHLFLTWLLSVILPTAATVKSVVIKDTEFGGERPLFESHNVRLENVTIREGESAIKECSNIEAVDCRFEGNYPFWHVHNFKIERCYFDVGGRSALWYSDNLQMKDTEIDGLESDSKYVFQYVKNAVIRNAKITTKDGLGKWRM